MIFDTVGFPQRIGKKTCSVEFSDDGNFVLVFMSKRKLNVFTATTENLLEKVLEIKQILDMENPSDDNMGA